MSAFLLGLLGSFHCIGMCGPIALALPQHEGRENLKFISAVLYNLGRVITYSIIGVVFGIIGKGLFIGGLQQVVSILTGSIIILIVIFPLIVPSKLRQASALQFSFFRNAFSKAFKMKSFFAYFLLGLINGLLPCGFVYIALSAAMLTGDIISGSMFMFFFGLGTIPAMLSMSLLGSFANIGLRNKIKKTIPYISVFIGLLLILRGLNLGIPYISPLIQSDSVEIVDCCRK